MAEYVCDLVPDYPDVHYDSDGYSGECIRRERIVRCRDCRHGYKDGTLCTHFSMLDDDDLSIRPSIVEPDGFCAWGEERDEL